MRDRVVLTGYLVRCPLGGYAWQILHYLAGLQALGFEAYFYEDTAFYGDCFDPSTGNMHTEPTAGVAFATDFFRRFGFADRWAFWDADRDRHYGLNADATRAILQDASLVLTLAAVNRLPARPGQRRVFIDIDPGFTQIRLAHGDTVLRDLLAEHDLHFTIGENIGTARCTIPSGGFAWRPTRQPVASHFWTALPPEPAAPFTTIGRWDESRRDVVLDGETYGWSKRTEWLQFLDLPRRTTESFTVAMDVDKTPRDAALLREHGWTVLDPLAISRDDRRYRQFIQQSRGEFTVAKDLNIRLASGWFSDRSACYLAAGRPVVTQDTGFGYRLPVGKGLFAIRGLDEAVGAFATIASDYPSHSRAARLVAEAHFDAGRVLGELIGQI